VSRHVGYILHHQSVHLAIFLLSQYDTLVPLLRDVNEVRQASTNYVRREALPFAVDIDISQHMTLTVGWLTVAVAIATNSQQQVFLMHNRAKPL